MVNVKFKKLDDRASIPQYAHVGDAGLDVKCIDVEYDKEHDMYIYHTGLACETPSGYAILGFMRSSNCKTDCYLTNGVGIIDSAIYRGEIQFRLKNRTALDPLFRDDEEITLAHAPYNTGDRIGQLMIIKLLDVCIEEANELSDSVRGENGFGSSGK